MLDKLRSLYNQLKEFSAQPLPHKVLYFDDMLTPQLIRWVYWLSLLVVFVVGIKRMFSGGLGYFVSGIMYIAIGMLCARIISELVILLFKMNDRIAQVAKNTSTSSAPSRNKATSKKVVSKKASKKVSKKTAT